MLCQSSGSLEPGGVVVLLYNNRRREAHPLLEALEQYLERHAATRVRDRRFLPFGEELAAAGFDVPAPVRIRWGRLMTPEEFVGMVLSSIRADALAQRYGRDAVVGDLRALIDQHVGNPDAFEAPYESEAVLGEQRRERRLVSRR